MPEIDCARQTKPREANRRSAARIPCSHQSPVRLLVLPGLPPVWGFTRDTSATGMGLLLSRPLEPGTVLTLELGQAVPGDAGTLSAQVVHATPFPKGGWLVGCQLSRPLRDDEL
jgi:PilZ domain